MIDISVRYLNSLKRNTGKKQATGLIKKTLKQESTLKKERVRKNVEKIYWCLYDRFTYC